MTSELVTPLSMLICGRIGIEPVVKSSSSSAGISSVGEHAESADAPMPVSSSRRVDDGIGGAGHFWEGSGARILRTTKSGDCGRFSANMVEKA